MEDRVQAKSIDIDKEEIRKFLMHEAKRNCHTNTITRIIRTNPRIWFCNATCTKNAKSFPFWTLKRICTLSKK